MTSGHDVTRIGYLDMAKRNAQRVIEHAEKIISWYDDPAKHAFHLDKFKARVADLNMAATAAEAAPLDCQCGDCLKPNSPTNAHADKST